MEPEHREQDHSDADVLSDELVAYWRDRLMAEVDLDELGALSDEQRRIRLSDVMSRILASEDAALPAQPRNTVIGRLVELVLSRYASAARPGLGAAQIYRQAREQRANAGTPYDVQSGLNRLRNWMAQDVSETPAITSVDADGTVYVRTADGERVIGSWQAGSPEEALAFYQRKFEALETEVVLLEQRMAATDMAPAQAAASVQRLLRSCEQASALGDLDGLRSRLERLTEDVGHKREEAKAAREHARVAAREIKERIVAEAEQIAAEATHWKSSGERMRELLEEWKAAPHAERAAEAALWKRLSAARNAFTKRRKAYFATLEAEREDVRARKEKLVADAEALSGSTDWGPTTSAFRELMRQWKAAGRADRDSEAELWKRFRAAQDKFFTARAEVFSAKDAQLREHAEAKARLLEQAQALLPVTDVRAARSALRGIQERWEQVGAVPRDSREQLESGLRRVEDAIRKAEETQWRKSNPEALARAEGTVAQLRSTIAHLEEQLAKARDRGDARAARNAEEALAARRSWLTEAENTLAEFTS